MGTMLGLTLGLFADASVSIELSTADGGEHNWTARSMQPHSKLGLFVGTILGLKLRLSVDALVGIVLGTGTSDKAPLEEAAVGAQLGCSVGVVRGTTIARNKARPGRLVVGTILGLRLGLFADASVGIVLGTAGGA